jgi:bisanhydrobacterioruberin hydratase
VLTQTLRSTPPALLLASALFLGAAYFAVRLPDAPGARIGSYACTFLIALPSFVALFGYLGAKRAALVLISLSAFGYVVETIGVATGLPYGLFYYGDSLGPKAFGLVPYLLPVSYVPLVLGAVAAARPAHPRPAVWILASALLLVAVDAVLDPGAASLGFWIWPEGGVYYGVPLSNFLGWMLSSVLAAALLLAVARPGEDPPPPGLLDGAVLAVAFWTGVAVFSGLALPALLGAALLAHFLRRRARLSESRRSRRRGYKL